MLLILSTHRFLRPLSGLCCLALAFSVTACSSQPPVAIGSAVNYEGLADVVRPQFDVAQVRPETVFSDYDGVILAAPELAFRTPVENITATVPSGRSMQIGFALTAVGEATLILELRDSQSEQILARGVETRAVQGAALGQGGEMLTRWEDVEKLCSRWASLARARLDALVDQS